MGITLGIIVGTLSLLFLLLVNKFNFSLARRIREKRLPFSTKVLFSFLNGFIIFIIFAPKENFIYPNIVTLQKIILVAVSLILIIALNIKIFSPKHRETEHQEK